MKVCALISAVLPGQTATASYDPVVEPELWLDNHQWRKVALRKGEAAARLPALIAEGVDVFLNLCDGMPFEDVAGAEVAEALDALGVPYTGPSPQGAAMTRREMKERLAAAGLPTPHWAFVHNEQELQQVAASFPLPAIVKHHNSYGSLGMGRDARVETPQDLIARAQCMLQSYGGALVEEFAPGPELTVLCVEDPCAPEGVHVYTPMVCAFPSGESFKHFQLKWCEFAGLSWSSVRDPELAEQAQRLGRCVFRALHARSYTRCDLRIDARGELTVLECNMDCAIFYPPGQEGCADQILQSEPSGHREFIRRILDAALLESRIRQSSRTTTNDPHAER